MEPVAIVVGEISQVSAARLAVQRLARALDFDEALAGRAALVTSEAVTNMVRHGQGGTFTARPLAEQGSLGIEMLAIDKGPGMRDYAHSARDGVTTGTTPGTGLGAIGRMTDELDVDTHQGRGTILRMVVWNRRPAKLSPYGLGAVVVPKAGETACGDAWAIECHSDGATFMVADGLGHGPDASRASGMAMEVLQRHPDASALRLLDLAHAKLRPTRGAALAVLRQDRARGEIAFAGVGNIAACVIDGDSRRAMVSHNGIVGHNMQKSQEYRYPWAPGSLLVAHSDGLESHWTLDAFPGIAHAHPALIAAALYRRHTRTRDDVVVLAVREAHA